MAICSEHIFIIATIFLLNIEQCFCACARAEYEINGECCPMCAPGSRVYRHCTEFVSTTCVPCVDSTFISEPSGFEKCINCAICDADQGLKVKTACTPTSNTVCEPLEGFYCTNNDKGSCTQAVEHRKCHPGQYIKQKGTAYKDTECAGCKNDTYSDGSFEVCKQHTMCEDLDLTVIKPGTTMSDAECGNKNQSHLIIGIVVCSIFVAVVTVALLVIFKFRRKNSRCAGTDRESPTEIESPTSETPFITT